MPRDTPTLGMADSRLRKAFAKWGLPAVVSLAVLAALATQADIERLWGSLGRIKPHYGLAAFTLLLLSLLSRAVRLRCLSSRYHGAATLRDCMRVTARHQAAFTILPSGSGDLVFPLFAQRVLSCPLTTASRMLFAFRALDAAAVLLMSVIAGMILFVELRPGWLFVLLLAGVTASGILFVSRAPDIAVAIHDIGVRLLRRLGEAMPPLGRRLRAPASALGSIATAATERNRWSAVLWTFLAWTFAGAAFWALFAMIGAAVGTAEAVLILAGVNAAGAVSFVTVAGLGVSEAGLAGVLVLLDFPIMDAVSLSLIVRPAALLMTMTSCAVCEVACRQFARVKGVVT